MGRKAQVAILAGVVFVLLGAIGAYAYDSSQKDKIADGVAIGGVDVGGLDATQAKQEVRRRLLVPLRHSITVSFAHRTWELPGESLGVHANLGAAVDEALSDSREGGLPGRVVRYVTGDSVDKQVPAGVTYSQPAVNHFVRKVARAVDREAQDASVSPSPDSLQVVAGRNGRKLRDRKLTHQLDAAVLSAGAPHAIVAQVHRTKPEVTKGQVASRYPTYLTLDRGAFKLRFWKNLKLIKTYTVAVGQAGLETPAGIYHIQDKQVDPSWHVPNSAWAGSLAGQTIPPGPGDPIKARWMGIFDGAGIHGTDETYSLGHAASHGCVRMAIPDVIDLYDRVDVGTPIYIG